MAKSKIWLAACALTVASLALGALIGGMVTQKGDFYRYLGIFSDVLTLIRKDYVEAIGVEYLIEGANRGLLAGLDAQSAFLTREELAEYAKVEQEADAEPGFDILKAFGYPVVISVYRGSPAEKAGLAPGDQIITIDGKSTRDLSILQFKKLMIGREGTQAKLSVVKMKTYSREDLNIKREKIGHAGYEAVLMNNQVAYLRIYDLGRLDIENCADSLKNMEKKAAAVLVDLRNSVSGDYRKASYAASVFIEKGPVLSVEKRGDAGRRSVEFSRRGFLWKKPAYVLINGGTAGPSEGLAMVLKEEATAVLMGEKSYGMGLAQEVITLEDGSGLILSTSRYMTQDGTAWNGTGITPSIEIKSEVAEIEKQMEEQLQKAFDYITKDRASKIKKAA